MAVNSLPSFDPQTFLLKVGDGDSLGQYRKGQIVFSEATLRMQLFTSRTAR
jgi:hypothetical protein